METLALSFFAGVLTILAPCILPVLPVVLGGTLTDIKHRSRAFLIMLSLAVSITVFTLLLRASTLLIMIPPQVWNILSGIIFLLFGLFTLLPDIWGYVATKVKFTSKSEQFLQKSANKKGALGPLLIGAALGPIFTSCSPTYALIVAVMLPQNFGTGLANLLAYVLGITLIFGAIALGGRTLFAKMKWALNPYGKFKRALGILFIIIGLVVLTGFEKKIESYLLDIGYANGLLEIEGSFCPAV